MNAPSHRPEHVCYCRAYKFPHRMGGGACTGSRFRNLCSCCGMTAELITIDIGIGPYEYWGSKEVDHKWVDVSDCCNADVVDNNAFEAHNINKSFKEAESSTVIGAIDTSSIDYWRNTFQTNAKPPGEHP